MFYGLKISKDRDEDAGWVVKDDDSGDVWTTDDVHKAFSIAEDLSSNHMSWEVQIHEVSVSGDSVESIREVTTYERTG